MQTRWISAVVIGLVATVAIGLLSEVVPTLVSWEASTYDLRVRWRGSVPVSDRVVLIGRDAESDVRFGAGLWDRAHFGKVIASLHRAGAVVIALDFHMAGASAADRGGPASDQLLVDATSSASPVLLPLLLSFGDEASLPSALPPGLRTALANAGPSLAPSVLHAVPQVGSVVGPFPALIAAAAGVGHIGALPDPDGVYRRVPTFVNAGGQAIPALGIAIAAAYLQVPLDRVTLAPGQSLTLPQAQFPDGQQRAVSLPVDSHGGLLISYAGRWTDGPFPYLSFADVWDAATDGREAEIRDLVVGKVVLLLHSSLGADKRHTPVDLAAPGGFILANVVNTVLQGQAAWELSSLWKWGLACLLSVASAWLLLSLPGWSGPGFVVATVVLYGLLAQGSFLASGLVLPMIVPIGTLLVSSGVTFGWMQWRSMGTIRRLESEHLRLHRAVAVQQEVLAHRETRVDQLEEELELTKTEVEASQLERSDLQKHVKDLQGELKVAKAQTVVTRQTIQLLEARLVALHTATVDRAPLPQAGWEVLRQDCARLGILTKDPAMLMCMQDLKKAARAVMPVLILGEPGTGKELCAHAVHLLSPRASKPFVAVNMSAIPADLFESELFGHVKGAFTGAVRDRAGFFEQAHEGTVFLDEIGDLRLDLQAKLLRVLQEQTFTRVGDTRVIKVDVRVVAATNRDLLQGIAQGWFREDLYYRLQGIECRLPPLRERPLDLPLLAEQFVHEATVQHDRPGVALSQGALEALRRHRWKGNIRELKHCLDKAVVLAEGQLILEQDLRLTPEAIDGHGVHQLENQLGDLRKHDPSLLVKLREYSFDIQATAEALGWDRSTVMQRFKGMCFQALVDQHGDRTGAARFLGGELGLSRLVEIKLAEYANHLLAAAQSFASVDEALAGCRRRFKNLPERYAPAMEVLIRDDFKKRE